MLGGNPAEFCHPTHHWIFPIMQLLTCRRRYDTLLSSKVPMLNYSKRGILMEMNIGNKIRELRKNKGITQEQLALALGITSQAVSRWEMNTGLPDIAMLPIIAGYFGVSMDALFNYNTENLEEKIMDILYNSRMDASTYESRSFEESEKILLKGIADYPGGHILKRELLDLYRIQIHTNNRRDLAEKALELGKQICDECEDSFICLGVKADMADIYITIGRYEEGKKLIESMPYRYPNDILDKMRCSAHLLKGEEKLNALLEWKILEHQELFVLCTMEGMFYYKTADYENALLSFQEVYATIDAFCHRKLPDAFRILGDASDLCAATVRMAACYFRLNRLEECDAALERAYRLIRDVYDDETWEAYHGIEHYRRPYHEMGLDAYKPCI